MFNLKYFHVFLIFILYILNLAGHGFSEETMVMTPRGPRIIGAINAFNDNQEVFSYDPDYPQCIKATVKASQAYTTNVHVGIFFGSARQCCDGFFCDPRQKFYLPRTKKWVPAYKLKVGDILLSWCSKEEPITKIFLRNEPLTIYSLEIEDSHNYLVGRHAILTHNDFAMPMPTFGIMFEWFFGQGADIVSSAFNTPLGPVATTVGISVVGLSWLFGSSKSGGGQDPRNLVEFDPSYYAEHHRDYTAPHGRSKLHEEFGRKSNGQSSSQSSENGPEDPEPPHNDNNSQSTTPPPEKPDNNNKERKKNDTSKKEFFESIKDDYEHWRDKIYKRKPQQKGLAKNAEYLEWDHLHQDVEVYNNNFEHAGSLDPATKEFYKSAIRGRKIMR